MFNDSYRPYGTFGTHVMYFVAEVANPLCFQGRMIATYNPLKLTWKLTQQSYTCGETECTPSSVRPRYAVHFFLTAQHTHTHTHNE